jgi:hypothetical protein
VHDPVTAPEMLAEFMDLGMTIVTPRNAIVRLCRLNLLVFDPAEFETLLFVSGLEKAPTAAAAIIIGSIGLHIDKILFSHDRPDNKPQVFCNGVAVAFANDLAGVLNRKLYFEILVPVGVDLEFPFANPFGVVFIDVLYFEVMLEIEFFQSGPD